MTRRTESSWNASKRDRLERKMFLKCQNFPNCSRFSRKKNNMCKFGPLAFSRSFLEGLAHSRSFHQLFFFAFSAFWVNAVPFFTSSRTYVILSDCITFATSRVQPHFVPQVELSNGIVFNSQHSCFFQITLLEHDLHECNDAVYHDTFDKFLHFCTISTE